MLLQTITFYIYIHLLYVYNYGLTVIQFTENFCLSLLITSTISILHSFCIVIIIIHFSSHIISFMCLYPPFHQVLYFISLAHLSPACERVNYFALQLMFLLINSHKSWTEAVWRKWMICKPAQAPLSLRWLLNFCEYFDNWSYIYA